MSEGKVIFNLQLASIGRPTLTRKSREERAPTVVSAPVLLSTVTNENCANPVTVKVGGVVMPSLVSIAPSFSSVVVMTKPDLGLAL